MKKIFSKLIIILATFLWVSCQEEYSMDSIDGIKATFELKQDLTLDAGGNTVILKNTTANSTPLFYYGTGKSMKQIDTLHFPFKGTYYVKFTAYTQGGYVVGDSIPFTVTQDNLNYVNDDLWTKLSGGVGNSKTWIADNGSYGMAAGFMSYASPTVTQEFENFNINWDPGNSNIGATANDLSTTMTFDLKDGAHLTVVKPNESTASLKGTYILDATNHTLTTTGVEITRIATYVTRVSNWTNNVKILELTNNQLRILVWRSDSDPEGKWGLVYNYVSKTYADSYVPAAKTPDDGYNPTFKPGEILDMLADTGKLSARRWKFDNDGNPIDWIAKGIGWTTNKNSTATWGWNSDWDKAADSSWIQFDRSNGKQTYTVSQKGVLTSGTFTIDETNNIVNLSTGCQLVTAGVKHWMEGNITEKTSLKIIKGWRKKYQTKGVWFGTSYDSGKDEWFASHYIMVK